MTRAARLTGVSRAAIRHWRDHPVNEETLREGLCFVCRKDACPTPDSYAYLLGQYLGDGYLVTSVRVPKLRIACADRYPAIAAEVDQAMRLISGNSVGSVQSIGCSDHWCYWMHWPCLFPQHGPGRKHERAIELANWQRVLVDAHPWPLIRGLIHSDGCRSVNTVVRRGRRYSYPRYFFANESRDILAIFASALDDVGLQWRYNRPNSISVARRDSVAALERHVGPKR